MEMEAPFDGLLEVMIFFTRNLFCLNSKVFFLVLRRSDDFFFTRDLFCLNSKFFFFS